MEITGIPQAWGAGRPKRLSDTARRFAYESLTGKYGKDTLRSDHVTLSPEECEGRTDLEKYDLAIRRIAEEAPIRICEGELVSGAATLGHAVTAHVPAFFGGKMSFWGITHLTVDFSLILRHGYAGMRAYAEKCAAANPDPGKAPFYQSAFACFDAFAVYRDRYLAALKDRDGYAENYRTLLRVPEHPAETFREAVQSVWFTFSFLRLCGGWPGIGRLDVLLGDYLKKDLAEGRITLPEARELLAHFFIKGCEWASGNPTVSGDAQHYQNIILSGTDENGRDVTNEVTYLVLDVVEETGIGDFPIAVRLHKNSPEKLLRRMAEVVRLGGGIVAAYDETTVMEGMRKYGYPPKEAASFTNDGCWEIQVPATTNFGYIDVDLLAVLQLDTLESYRKTDFADYEELYQSFVSHMEGPIAGIVHMTLRNYFGREDADMDTPWKEQYPCTLISLFVHDCIEKGCSYLEGGPRYQVQSPHIGGLADTANALYAIKKLVFEEKRISLAAFFAVLRNNWEGEEPLRRYVSTRYLYYGNGNEEVDAIAAGIIRDFAAQCRKFDGISPFRFPAGASTFGRQLEWAPHRLATPFGSKANAVLAGNASPTPGTDRVGATGVIASHCAADMTDMVTGAALDLQLPPSAVEGEEGIAAIMGLYRGFVGMGGSFLQLDVADAAILREAQKHPENYQTLSVRVSGWNARFATLSKPWQDMVIERTEKGQGYQ